MVLDLALDDPSRPLRGEILRLPLDQGWLFTGLPTVRRAGDLASYGLSLSDFPSHHGMGELLLANESTHMMLETTVSQQQELTTLNDELRRQIAVRSEKIFKAHFDPHFGLQSYQVRRLCQQLEISGPAIRAADKFMKALCRVFVETDCSLAEINPLVVTGNGELVALDAKMSFDGNALYRQKDIEALRDIHEEDPSELEAGKFGLSYVKLDGNIGCLVNGAGLAMSTMDIIQFKVPSPRTSSMSVAVRPRSRSLQPSRSSPATLP